MPMIRNLIVRLNGWRAAYPLVAEREKNTSGQELSAKLTGGNSIFCVFQLYQSCDAIVHVE